MESIQFGLESIKTMGIVGMNSHLYDQFIYPNNLLTDLTNKPVDRKFIDITGELETSYDSKSLLLLEVKS